MAQIPLTSNSKRPQFFSSDGSDELTSMMLELMAELWTVKERVFVLESVLSETAPSLLSRVEAFKPTEEQAVHLESARTEFIKNVLRCIEKPTPESGK